MRKAIILLASLVLAGAVAQAQNTGTVDEMVRQNQLAADQASQRYKDQSRANSRRIDLLEDSIARDQREINRLKPELKAAKENLKLKQEGLKLQKGSVKNRKKAGASKDEIKVANQETKRLQNEVKQAQTEVNRINGQIKDRNKSISNSRKNINSLRKDTRDAKKDMQQSKKNLKTAVVTTTPQMHCENCENKIKKNIRFEKGVTSIETSIAEQTVTITYDAAKNTPKALQAAMKKIGYDTKVLSDKPLADTKAKSDSKAPSPKGK
mgnify:CR=1 FL=1